MKSTEYSPETTEQDLFEFLISNAQMVALGRSPFACALAVDEMQQRLNALGYDWEDLEGVEVASYRSREDGWKAARALMAA